MSIKFIIVRRNNRKAYGTLSWNKKNLEAGAISGPYGRAELPDGLYHIKRSGLIDRPQNPAFCDSLNNCWFQLIKPQFSTIRTELGIHPDGNQIGTLGCIGLIESNTKPWYDAFYQVPRNSHIVLEVIDQT